MNALESLINQATNGRCFVAFARPDEEVLHIWQADSADTDVTDGFVMAPFVGSPIGISRAKATFSTADVSEFLPALSSLEFEPDSPEPYTALVKKAVNTIRGGSFSKVVLSRVEKHEFAVNLTQSFSNLLHEYPTAFRYLWFAPQTGFWMGASPEVLVKAKENRFETMALAGTQLFAPHIFWADKERQEQYFVTFFITESLKSLVDDLHVSEPYTSTAGRLAHLRTDIKGVLKADASWTDVIKVLHPTPAVCGYPKFDALDFITLNEGYDRSYYSGYLGEISPEQTDLYVNLRCMRYSDGTISLYVGGGVTTDSVPELEFTETVNKSATIKKILA
jgi:isochorismate synthase